VIFAIRNLKGEKVTCVGVQIARNHTQCAINVTKNIKVVWKQISII